MLKLKNFILLIVFCFSLIAMAGFNTETHNESNLIAINQRAIEHVNSANNLAHKDSIPNTKKGTLSLKRTRAHRLGLISFAMISISYLIYLIIGGFTFGSSFAIIAYAFIGLVVIGLIGMVLAIRSMFLFRREKSKKGIIWSVLALILGAFPLLMFALVLFALRTFN